MSHIEAASPPKASRADRELAWPADPVSCAAPPRRRIFAPLLTLAAVVVATALTWAMWQAYMGAPWTRDGTVRAYVVTMAPEVAGRVVELLVTDNQFVRKGDLLMVIDSTDYRIALDRAEATAEETKAVADNADAEAERRRKLTNLAISDEEKQIYASMALRAKAAYDQALANRDQARVNLERTRIVSPVDGYVTNLLVQLGDYVNVGQSRISVVNSNSFWIDAYFEETKLGEIRDGDPAMIKLMTYREPLRGHVDSLARGIVVPNAQAGVSGLATVNPIFTWVRLAQRVPVRIRLEDIPENVRLVTGMTATVQIDPHRPR
jgi:RND family efflux transporter MFP subunit